MTETALCKSLSFALTTSQARSEVSYSPLHISCTMRRLTGDLSTFLKRKGGLFKKAHELSVLCSVDVAVIIFGHNKKLYEYSSGDINETIGRFQYVRLAIYMVLGDSAWACLCFRQIPKPHASARRPPRRVGANNSIVWSCARA